MRNPWKEIKAPVKDVSALRVNPNHPLDLYWAMDHIGRYLFIYEYPENSEIIINDPPDLEGVETISMSTKNNNSRLVLVLKDKTNWELFFSLCNDLLNATAHIKSSTAASSTILNRLRRWHDFLRKNRLNILSEEKIKGLIGELFFIKQYLIPKYGSADAISFWIGPEGAPQDFNINNCAIEVKSQLGGTIPSVKISSLDQLFSQLPKLFLYVVTLGKAPNDHNDLINLPSLIEEITGYLEKESDHLNIFQDKLLEVGYYYSQKYLDYNYLLTNEQIYSVHDDFPRICPNDVRQGISRVTYNIELSECSKYKIDITILDFNND